MTRTSADTVVIGGGIAGLTIALALGDDGHRVTLVDDARPGAASRASAGMLAPGLGFTAEMQPHAERARDLYPSFLARLREESGIAVPLDRRGIIEVATTDAEAATLHARGMGTGTDWLDASALARLEPRLQGLAGGLLHAHDGAVDIASLMQALTIAADRHPRIRVVVASVTGVAFDAGMATALTAGGGREHGGQVVLAGGAWAASITGLPRTLPVRPVKGELMLVDGPTLGHVICGSGGYLIPRRDGLLVGATSVDGEFQPAPTDAGGGALRRIAAQLVGNVDGARVIRHWGGLRPVSPDGLPIVGRDPNRPALVYACGLSRNGILLAPWIARELARELGGDSPGTLRGLRIERFERRKSLPGKDVTI